MSGEVPAGASMPCQFVDSNPGTPASLTVGIVGAAASRWAPVTAIPFNLPSRTSGRAEPGNAKPNCTSPETTSRNDAEPEYGT